jgi:hypothetical protein
LYAELAISAGTSSDMDDADMIVGVMCDPRDKPWNGASGSPIQQADGANLVKEGQPNQTHRKPRVQAK